MAKHPIGHDCPKNMVWSDEKGKCINPELEVVNGAENPNE